MKQTFLQKHPNLEDRKSIYEETIQDYPGKIPVICEPAQGSDLAIDHTVYAVHSNFNVIKFTRFVQKDQKFDKQVVIVPLLNGKALPSDALLADLQKDHKGADGFLYIQFRG